MLLVLQALDGGAGGAPGDGDAPGLLAGRLGLLLEGRLDGQHAVLVQHGGDAVRVDGLGQRDGPAHLLREPAAVAAAALALGGDGEEAAGVVQGELDLLGLEAGQVDGHAVLVAVLLGVVDGVEQDAGGPCFRALDIS